MRIPYVADPPSTSGPEEAEILSSIQTRRGEGGMLALDRALLHSYPVANGWNSFFGAIRSQTSLPDDLRELAICRIAAINHARYEWDQHAPLLEATGFSQEAFGVLANKDLTGTEDKVLQVLNPRQIAVLRYTDAMTKNIAVPEEIFDELRQLFTEKEIVEITATVAGYNCVSRFLVALNVGERNGVELPILQAML